MLSGANGAYLSKLKYLSYSPQLANSSMFILHAVTVKWYKVAHAGLFSGTQFSGVGEEGGGAGLASPKWDEIFWNTVASVSKPKKKFPSPALSSLQLCNKKYFRHMIIKIGILVAIYSKLVCIFTTILVFFESICFFASNWRHRNPYCQLLFRVVFRTECWIVTPGSS